MSHTPHLTIAHEIRSDLKALGVSKNGLARYMADFNSKYLDDLKY